jgi:hypothetical protein
LIADSARCALDNRSLLVEELFTIPIALPLAGHIGATLTGGRVCRGVRVVPRVSRAPVLGRARSGTDRTCSVIGWRHRLPGLVPMPTSAASDRAVRHNLPAAVTSCIGREGDVAAIMARLAESPAGHAYRRRRLRKDPARAGEPLELFLTATRHIDTHRQGILGPIWRRPGRAELGGAGRGFWLPERLPRGVILSQRIPRSIEVSSTA